MITIHRGRGNTITAALLEAVQDVADPRLILFFVNGSELEYTASTLHRWYPDIATMGMCSCLYACGKVDHEKVVLLSFDDDTPVRSGVIRDISQCPVQSVYQLEKDMAALSPGQDDTICLEFCTGSEETLVTTLNAVLEPHSVPLIGTTVYGDAYSCGYVVAYNGRLYTDSCIYVMIRNRQGRIMIFNENIYQPRADAPMHIATKVDRSQKALVELDGLPAAQVYSRELGVPVEDVVKNVMMHPLGRILGDHLFTFSMREQLPDGTLYNFKQINRNDAICLLELRDYEQIFEQTIQRIQQEIPHSGFVFSIDCIYRYMLYSSLEYLQTYARKMNTLGPHMGVTGAGEQIRNQHVNQNMVCAVFEDTRMEEKSHAGSEERDC